MAWRMKVRLPSLKVTQRGSSNSPAKAIVPRGRRGTVTGETATADILDNKESFPASVSDVCHSSDFMPCNADDERETYPTLHTINEAANAIVLRSDLLRAVTESFAVPIGECCHMCSETAECRCVQCGPTIYYCLKCYEVSHSTANIFHTAEVWDVSRLHCCTASDCFPSALLKPWPTDVLEPWSNGVLGNLQPWSSGVLGHRGI